MGNWKKIPVGYIETPRPLGAGVYVLVEVQTPDGYVKAGLWPLRSMGTKYLIIRKIYAGTGPWMAMSGKTAAKYEYAIPVTGEGNKTSYETVSQIPVKIILQK